MTRRQDVTGIILGLILLLMSLQVRIFFVSSSYYPTPTIECSKNRFQSPRQSMQTNHSSSRNVAPQDDGVSACLLVMDDNHYLIGK